MRRTVVMTLSLVGSMVVAVVPAKAQDAKAKQIEHGRYLVEDVAFCQNCHTPRTQSGEPDRARWMHGAPVGGGGGGAGRGAGQQADPNRPKEAPAIAGLPEWSEADAIKFLTTGVEPDGSKPRAPMRPYRFTAQDAADVVAYLKSLKPATQ